MTYGLSLYKLLARDNTEKKAAPQNTGHCHFSLLSTLTHWQDPEAEDTTHFSVKHREINFKLTRKLSLLADFLSPGNVIHGFMKRKTRIVVSHADHCSG